MTVPSNSFTQDIWLTEVLQKPVFNLAPSTDYTDIQSLAASSSPSLLTVKLPTDDHLALHQFQQQGFRVIDTNLQLVRPASDMPVMYSANIDLAAPADEPALYQLAYDSFYQNRFHRDPEISQDLASKVKALWVTNFFRGKRGKFMLVSNTNKEISGFLQILATHNNEMLIDLIAVKTGFRNQGIAAQLIGHAYNQLFSGQGRIFVGTQAGNLASLRLYQKMGFMLVDASYILHKHVE